MFEYSLFRVKNYVTGAKNRKIFLSSDPNMLEIRQEGCFGDF
jgi:hypothetical protein